MAKAKGETPGVIPRLARLDEQLAMVELRLGVVERRGRRLRWLAASLGLLAVVALTAAAAALLAPYNEELAFYLGRVLGKPGVFQTRTIVEAEQFVLRASDGRIRAALALRGGQSVGLDLYDADGKARAGLDLSGEGRASLWLAPDETQTSATLTTRGLRLGAPDGGTSLVAASGMTLLDRSQKSRVALVLRDGDAPALTLFDRDGKPGALVDVSAEGSRLGLFYGGVVRAGIGHGRGGSQLNLFSEDGHDHATLGLMPDGSTGLLFHDRDGKQRIALGVLANDNSGLSLFDKTEKPRAGLSVMGEGSPHLELFDGTGARRAGLALSPEGLPALQLEDRGQPRAILGAATLDGKRVGVAGKPASTSSLLLFDKDGALVFQAPVY